MTGFRPGVRAAHVEFPTGEAEAPAFDDIAVGYHGKTASLDMGGIRRRGGRRRLNPVDATLIERLVEAQKPPAVGRLDLGRQAALRQSDDLEVSDCACVVAPDK